MRSEDEDVMVPEHLRARAAQPPPPALEQVRSFLRGTASDADGPDDVRADLASRARVNAEAVRRDLNAVEAVIAEPPGDEDLTRLVAWDANQVLEGLSGPAALAWLRELAALIREVLSEADR
jgi:hypothetical protein